MNPTIKKAGLFFVLLTVLGTLGWSVRWFLAKRGGEVRLAARSEQAVPRMVLGNDTMYRQRDPQWAEEKTGGSRETLSAVGCTVCGLSMALAQHGVALNPAELNRKLQDGGGYTEQGWVKWDAVRGVTGGRVAVELPAHPSQEDIDTALAAGNPVLVKVYLAPGVQHWVLLVGREGREYLMKDPLGDGKSLGLLSSLGSDIFAVRIVKGR